MTKSKKLFNPDKMSVAELRQCQNLLETMRAEVLKSDTEWSHTTLAAWLVTWSTVCAKAIAKKSRTRVTS